MKTTVSYPGLLSIICLLGVALVGCGESSDDGDANNGEEPAPLVLQHENTPCFPMESECSLEMFGGETRTLSVSVTRGGDPVADQVVSYSVEPEAYLNCDDPGAEICLSDVESTTGPDGVAEVDLTTSTFPDEARITATIEGGESVEWVITIATR